MNADPLDDDDAPLSAEELDGLAQEAAAGISRRELRELAGALDDFLKTVRCHKDWDGHVHTEEDELRMLERLEDVVDGIPAVKALMVLKSDAELREHALAEIEKASKA